MLLINVILATAITPVTDQQAAQCVAVYTQSRRVSQLERCLGLAPTRRSIEAQRLFDMCDLLRVHARERGFTLTTIGFTLEGKPGHCTYEN